MAISTVVPMAPTCPRHHAEWIRVEDDMPEVGVAVFACLGETCVIGETWKNPHMKNRVEWVESWGATSIYGVTHWMPLFLPSQKGA